MLNNKSKIVLALYVLVMVLLPFSRLSELPILILSIIGIIGLLKNWQTLIKQARFRTLGAVYLSYLFMVLLSASDSYWQDKTLIVAISSIRFYLATIALICYLRPAQFVQFIRIITILLIFWAVDAMIQYFFGVDLLARSSYPGRLNGIFGQHHVKLGPVLALLLPIAIIGLQKSQALLRWSSIFVIIITILLSGTRSAWLMMLFTLLAYWWHHVKQRRLQLLLKTSIAAVVMLFSLWFISPDFQQRINRSMAIFQGTEQGIDFALANRLEIWSSAWQMFVHHPINGIGAHAFRKAYGDYAQANDSWQQQGGVGMHAHHWLLEILAETGIIGLLLMLIAIVQLVRFIQKNYNSSYSWAFLIALIAAFLPITSTYSMFASFWSICIWFIGAGLLTVSHKDDKEESEI